MTKSLKIVGVETLIKSYSRKNQFKVIYNSLIYEIK